MNDVQWAIVITTNDGEAPAVFGPYDTEQEARYAEDRYTDAPKGAWAHIVPMWSAADVKEVAEA